MAVANAGLRRLSEPQRRLLEGWLLEFDQSWTAGLLDERARRLPPVGLPLHMPALTELVKIDLEQQWRSGSRPRLEDYLGRFPELGTSDSVAADLIQAEYEVRKQFGDPADLADFRRRFPRQADELTRLLAEARAVVSDAELARPAGDTKPPHPTPPSGSRPAPEELSGQFGRYRIEKRLGRGGMGSVYLAHDTQLDRRVALKVPHFTPEDGPHVLQRFYREARAAATLDHPNICPVHDVGEVGGVPYLTMAFIEGKPLAAFVQAGKPLPQPQAAAVVRKLALALQEAHRHGVIHRDLKPANVMINARREPVIMDFGLARRANKQEVRLTQLGSIMGTPAYMPPEQVTGDVDRMGPACDIYSLGVILYELLTGRLPFEGNVVSVLMQVATETPPPPSAHRHDLDPRLEAVCLKAMAKKPEDRYGSMAELARDLGDYLRRTASHAGATTTASVPVALPAPDETPPRRPRWAAIAAAGAGAVLLMGIIIYITTKNGRVAIHVDDPDARVEVRAADEVTNSVGMKLVAIPAGKFLMGPADGEAGAQGWEQPRHPVEIARPFHMGACEVTQEEYEKVTGTNPSWFCAVGEGKEAVAGLDTRKFPVEMVSWEDAAAFCRKLSRLPEEKKAARAYRLPTEAEWEYACRAGTGTPFAFGNALSSQQANIDGRFPYGSAARGPFLGRTAAVGSYAPNLWGLCDMHGNVWEWCADYHDPHYYARSPTADPRGPDKGELRICRGGGWFDVVPGQRRDDWRSANRGMHPPGARRNDVGFRVVCVPADREPGLADEPADDTTPPPPATDRTVNLLALIDLQKTFVKGEWKVRHGALVSPAGPDSILQIPYVPPEEYRLVVVAERNWYAGALNLGLTVGNTRAEAVLDGWEGTKSGLGLLDGKSAGQNETTRPGRFLKDGRPSTVVCTVRKDGVAVTVDGREIIHWQGNPELLAIAANEAGSDPRALFLTTYTAYTITRLELTPLAGEGRRLDAAAGEVRRLPCGGGVRGLALAPDGRRLLAGTTDLPLRLWDVTTGSLHTLEGNHGGTWNGVAFTRDGRYCLSGSTDGTVRLWDPETGRDLVHFVGHSGNSHVMDLALSPDGRRLLSADGLDGSLRLWQMPSEEDLRRRLAGQPADDPHGLKAEYFNGTELKNKVLERIDDQVNWHYSGSSPAPDYVGPNYYSVRWTGWLKPPVKGRYRFAGYVDDGIRLWLDGKQLLDIWAFGDRPFAAAADLTDEPHALKIEYYQDRGPAALVFRWSLAGGFAEQPVPRECLFHDEDAARAATVRLGNEVRRLSGHKGTVWGVAFAPDGRHALSAGEDGTVRLWDVDAGTEVRRLTGHKGPVWCVAFSPDGKRVLTGGSDQTLRLWHVATGRELRCFRGHRAGVRSVAFSPDGHLAVSGGFDHTVRVWDLETDQELHKEVCCFRGHSGDVHAVGFFPDGRRVFSGADDGTARVWVIPEPSAEKAVEPAAPGKPVDILKQIDLANTFVRGTWVLEGGELKSPPGAEKFLQLPYSPPDEYRLEMVVEGNGPRDALGLGLVVGGRQAAVVLDGYSRTKCGLSMLDGRGYEDNESTRPGPALNEGKPTTVVCTVRRDRVVVTCDGRPVLDWKGDPRRLDLHASWRVPDPSALFLASWTSYTISKLELTPLSGEGHRTEDGPGELRRFPHGASSVAFSPDGRQLLTGGDRFLRLLDVAEARQVRILEGHRAGIWRAVFSHDGRRLLSGGEDGTVRLWDAGTGEPLHLFAAHPGGWVRCVAFSPDGLQAATGGHDGAVRLWDLPPAEPGGTGLSAEYFQGTDLEKSAGKPRIDRVIDWLRDATPPFPGLGRDYWSARWTGWLKAPAAGRYQFALYGDDGVRVRLDGKPLFDTWAKPTSARQVKEVDLDGEPHPLAVEYFQLTGPSLLSLQWAQVGGFREQPVPSDALFHDRAAALKAVVKVPGAVHRFDGHGGEGGTWAVAFSPDGKQLLSGGGDGVVRLSDVETGKELLRLEGHAGIVRGVSFLPGGRQAVSAGQDWNICLWDLTTGKLAARLRGHRAAVTSVAVYDGGRRLISTGDDGTLRVWNLETQALVARLDGHKNNVLAVAVSPDGRQAASGSWDGTVRVWRLPR